MTPRKHRTHRMSPQLIISLSFFIGKPLTVFDAGFALNTHGSFVKGFTPLRAGLAGLTFSLSLMFWPILKVPVFFNSEAHTSMYASTAAFTSLRLMPQVSATDSYTAEAVRPLF